jgi:hypothetical protein
MTKFITGKDLSDAVYDIIWNAQKTLLIVSPFIKLDSYFREIFDNHIHNPKIHILIVFGKNENQLSKSLSESDFDYFKKFINISIVYKKNLHAKYYANESNGVITSMNLYDYSFKNNIEYGVFYEKNLLDNLKKSAYDSAWETSILMAESGEAIFIKRPVYQKKFLSTILGKNYVQSSILHDTTERFYSKLTTEQSNRTKYLKDFDHEIILGSTSKEKNRPERVSVTKIKEEEKVEMGYCIRTGVQIPFNVKMPYSTESYIIWKQFNNLNYQEYYCHKTGKKSFGKTSMKNPIL